LLIFCFRFAFTITSYLIGVFVFATIVGKFQRQLFVFNFIALCLIKSLDTVSIIFIITRESVFHTVYDFSITKEHVSVTHNKVHDKECDFNYFSPSLSFVFNCIRVFSRRRILNAVLSLPVKHF